MTIRWSKSRSSSQPGRPGRPGMPRRPRAPGTVGCRLPAVRVVSQIHRCLRGLGRAASLGEPVRPHRSFSRGRTALSSVARPRRADGCRVLAWSVSPSSTTWRSHVRDAAARPGQDRARADRVPERVHLRGRRAARRRVRGDGQDRDAGQDRGAGRGGPRGRRDDHARADHVRAGLRRADPAPVRDPQGRRGRQRVRQGHLGRRDRRRPGARPRATSSSRASAAWTRSPAPTSTSSCAARASRP